MKYLISFFLFLLTLNVFSQIEPQFFTDTSEVKFDSVYYFEVRTYKLVPIPEGFSITSKICRYNLVGTEPKKQI